MIKIKNKSGKVIHEVLGESYSGLKDHPLDLKGLDLSSIDLSYANLQKATLSESNLNDACLIGADLSGAQLQEVQMSRANLEGATLTGAVLSGATLINSNLSNAHLQLVQACNASFKGSSFISAVISNSAFTYSKLCNTNLSHAIIFDSDLYGCDLRWANLFGTKFVGSIFEKVTLLDKNDDRSSLNLKEIELPFCGNGKEIKSMYIIRHPITYTKDHIVFGCMQRTIEEWRDRNYIKQFLSHKEMCLYDKYIDLIFEIIDKFPAE